MKRFSRSIMNLCSWLFSLGFSLVIIAGILGVLLFNHYSKDLPAYDQLAKYDPPTVTRLYASDGKLLAEYATQNRVFVPLSAIPVRVRQAFISAEDKNFYEHTGVDITGIARALRDNIIHYGQDKSLVGGSTITQQVVKNFLLTSEKSIERKIREAILALRISQVYSKDKILELYLNEIYLGQGSYGVAAAAQNYFNKSLDDLTLEEIALLAAMPKAPSGYDPKRNYQAALDRRNWVIDRMVEVGFVPSEEAAAARKTPITLRKRDADDIARAGFFSEEVRRWLSERYGDNALYEGGLVVKTTLDPQLQQYADAALRKALIAYDRRRGYRGAVAHLATMDNWRDPLSKLAQEHQYHLLADQKLAVVAAADDRKAEIVFGDSDLRGIIPMPLLKWTRLVVADGVLGPDIKKPADVLKVGDVVIVGPPTDEQKKSLSAEEQKRAFDLQQIPEISGAMVVLDPHTGRVLAMSGGYSYGGNEFNRATQARRQPGSAFKPFVYLAGLENGFTPATIILDAPIEMVQGPGMPPWRPQNYKDEYLGLATMRQGLEKSRNTMTVRMAEIIGIDKVIDMGKRLSIYDDLPRQFSIVLGSAETTPLRLASAYGMIVNGGWRITPSLIERIDDRHGKTIYRRDNRACDNCSASLLTDALKDVMPPIPPDNRERVLDPRVAYQMISMLEGVTIRGTAARAHAELKRPVAGKTGTTNNSNDVWFMGFSPDLVAGVYIGYDRPRTLGKKETGGSVALPAFTDFMKNALVDKPNLPFRIPRGIELVRVDMETGEPVSGVSSSRTVSEAFITGDPIYIPGVTPPPDFSASIPVPPESAPLPEEPVTVSPPPPPPVEEFPRQPPIVGTGGLY